MGDYLRSELETVINFNDEDATATVYTRQRPMIRKLDSLCEKFPEAYKVLRRTELDATYEMPKKLISFRSPAAPKEMTEEEKQLARDRMKALHEKMRLKKSAE